MIKLSAYAKEQVPSFLKADINGYAMLEAIDAGLQPLLHSIETIDDLLTDIDTMPKWAVDSLAWEYALPWYDYGADIAFKRSLLKSAQYVKHMIGTKKGMMTLLRRLFPDVEIEEAEEYCGLPFHFRVTAMGSMSEDNPDGILLPKEIVAPACGAWISGKPSGSLGYVNAEAGGAYSKERMKWVLWAVNQVKPLRSVLDDLAAGHRERIRITATSELAVTVFPKCGAWTMGRIGGLA